MACIPICMTPEIFKLKYAYFCNISMLYEYYFKHIICIKNRNNYPSQLCFKRKNTELELKFL